MDAVTLLTIYLVLLLAIPSNLVIAPLASLGRPSTLWGVVLMAFWIVNRLQRAAIDVRPVRQPVRFVFICLIVIALVSFAAAMLRGQPADQVSPAFTALVRLFSWAGVLFVTIDGIRTTNDLNRLLRRMTIAAGLLAALGIAQFLTGRSLIDFWSMVPGLSGSAVDLGARGGLARSPGTATHPLEFATALNALLPIAIAAAISHGFRWQEARHRLRWWLPVGLISVCALVGVSRSAIIGFATAVVCMIPAIPRGYRAIAMGAGAILATVVVAAVPGLLATTLQLFTGASSDPSTQSRTSGLERAPEFISNSPVIGAGFGTFLPRYYIFDNEWVLITVELGILGVLAFASIFATAIWSAVTARRHSGEPGTRLVAYALGASVIIIAVLFAFFDGLGFPISGGIFFLIVGLCGAIRTIGIADSAHSLPAVVSRPGVLRSAGARS